MPESLAHKISLSFIPIIFAEGHIMNSPFVTIVPWCAYGDMTRVSVRWFYKVEACTIIHMSLYVLSHITAWTQGQPLLPVLCNSGRFLTIPLTHIAHNVIHFVMHVYTHRLSPPVVKMVAHLLPVGLAIWRLAKMHVQKVEQNVTESITLSHFRWQVTPRLTCHTHPLLYYTMTTCGTYRFLTRLLEGIFSDSKNIFLWHESEDIDKNKSLLLKFQLISILRTSYA